MIKVELRRLSASVRTSADFRAARGEIRADASGLRDRDLRRLSQVGSLARVGHHRRIQAPYADGGTCGGCHVWWVLHSGGCHKLVGATFWCVPSRPGKLFALHDGEGIVRPSL